MNAGPTSAVLPVPGRCIWCLGPADSSDSKSSDRSHVLLAVLGNAEHVLPPGIVCRSCNNYFGAKLDPVFAEFSPIRMIAPLLEVMNTTDNKLFRDTLPGGTPIPETPSDLIHVAIFAERSRLVLDLHRPLVNRCEVNYSRRDLQALSRAVHKLLVESLALQIYVRGHDGPIDLFDSAFDDVRRWVRRGEPSRPIRAWLWQLSGKDVRQSWRIQPLWRAFGRGFVQLCVFGNWFVIDGTSKNRDVRSSLRQVHSSESESFCFSDTIELLEPRSVTLG